jgi:hypothetical protein
MAVLGGSAASETGSVLLHAFRSVRSGKTLTASLRCEVCDMRKGLDDDVLSERMSHRDRGAFATLTSRYWAAVHRIAAIEHIGPASC